MQTSCAAMNASKPDGAIAPKLSTIIGLSDKVKIRENRLELAAVSGFPPGMKEPPTMHGTLRRFSTIGSSTQRQPNVSAAEIAARDH
jgi:hypothetical protein